jgi:formylglycine-generating enzyme required for sulfatase activity
MRYDVRRSSLALLILVLACRFAVQAAFAADPGFVAGDDRPANVDGNVVRVADGWLVPYDETIPGTDVRFTMVPVPGGEATIGSGDGEKGRDAVEGPVHRVRIEPFWIGRCEVTWGEYKLYMAACDLFKALEAAGVRKVTPENVADAVTAPSNLYDPTTTFTNGEEPLQPAVTMTQFAARQYTKWLSGLTGRFYRLPTESEWEYACRAGTKTPWHCGADANSLGDVAWFADTSDETTHPVGELEPNAWGLHDMHGNVAEWVVDQLLEKGYARQATLPQPAAAADCIEWPTELSPRVVRGGAYYDEPAQCRSAARRGSEDLPWKDVDPNLPKSPWWYTEEPALGVGMRVVRPFAAADAATRKKFWDADIESIQADTEDRIQQGRGGRGLVDPKLPEEAKAAGVGG